MELTWLDGNRIEIDKCVRPKKITGTKLGVILGANYWSTPFEAWCDITKVYKTPFEETKYTLAGKAIEPKQIKWLEDSLYLDNLVRPADVFGNDFFNTTYGNFFTNAIFGGMWDALLVNKETWDGTNADLPKCTETVIECKTTKRIEDWKDGSIPEYYALQAALYAYLLNCDDVVMVVTALSESDYDAPEDFVVTPENTFTREFKVSERYPHFRKDIILKADKWYKDHVIGGVSPKYDEKDAEIIKELQKKTLNPDADIHAMLDELTELESKVDIVMSTIAADTKRIKNIKEQLKKYATNHLGDNTSCEFTNGKLKCSLKLSTSFKPDEDKLKEDGLWNTYVKEVTTSRFTVTKVK